MSRVLKPVGTTADAFGPAKGTSSVVNAAEAPSPVRLPVGSLRSGGNNVSAAAQRRGCRVLCLCEITNFTTLRRNIGLPRADTLIMDVARHIGQLFSDMRIAIVGRSSIELSFERESPVLAAGDIDQLRRTFQKPVMVDGEAHVIAIQFGIAATPANEKDDVHLAEAAESALVQARIEGCVVMLDLSRAELAFDRLTLMRELPDAIAEGQMFVQYQPKVNVRRQEIVSAEALIRWQHPTRGLILPGDFILAAEEAGEIAKLTLWTLRQVLQDQRIFAADGHDIPVFINISGVLLGDAGFVEQACELVRDSAGKIGFEITETSVIRDPTTAIHNLNAFAKIGIPLAIDDYGAGLSSLAYLKQLPAKELKIDKMFVMQLTSSNRDPLIVRSTIDLAHALEMQVTAEGVETPAALALLSVMGCDMVQGYLISRPLSIDAFRTFVIDQAHLNASGNTPTSFALPQSFWGRTA